MPDDAPRIDLPLPIADSGTMRVPVYDCHVIMTAPDAEGVVHARVSTLPEITACGQSERHVLQSIVKDFKSTLVRYRELGEPVPWRDAEKPQSGETQRWIPVHL